MLKELFYLEQYVQQLKNVLSQFKCDYIINFVIANFV